MNHDLPPKEENELESMSEKSEQKDQIRKHKISKDIGKFVVLNHDYLKNRGL